ncbi:TPA: hypothetical protein ACGO00_000379 [Streptococcus suis]
MTELQKLISNMTENERSVFAEVKNATFDNLKPRKDITKATGLGKRTIEQIIVNLRNKYGIPVYALKRDDYHGYFIARTEEERQAGITAYRKQIDISTKNLKVMIELDLQAYHILVASQSATILGCSVL